MPDMASDPPSRPLLPQTTPTQNFSFAPQGLGSREPQQRNYVFVDEHNRHKRLKVMRACEGCRRRKIKCDSATTNSWPCAACTRLKLNCVPPTVSYEKDGETPGVHTFDVRGSNDYPTISVGTIGDYQRPSPMQTQHPQHYGAMPSSIPGAMPPVYAEQMPVYQSTPYLEPGAGQGAMHYASVPGVPAPDLHQQALYSTSPSQARPTTGADGSYTSGPTLAESLSDAMGELKIDHLSTAPYIADKKKLAETPAVEEYEIDLPQDLSPDQRVRIPLEMMPTDQQAMQYFQYFFDNIHPYVPVLSQPSFYHQWNTNRDSVSPLVLEAIFACSAFMMNEPSNGHKWLALASKHEESFKDVPRLSTIQAMCLLLKARESAPKRGYFYRSWMILVNIVAMAKDLELDQHMELHKLGHPCDSSVFDCICKTRTWLLLYVLEVMIGGPQGRLDMGVPTESIDFDPPQPVPGYDETELQIARQWTFAARVVRNIRLTMMLYAKLRKTKKDWALDPEFAKHDLDFPRWPRELPRDLQLILPPDGSAPYIPNSFVANMHCYHYLSVIMHHRPQIHSLEEAPDGGGWKQHMLVCHDAAKKMCRIQESILQNYGLAGLICMQRGMSFTIYCVLTSTMIHLASITSPDPDLNSDARDYFVRHMRILEQCTPAFPIPEAIAQINSLREAFSANLNAPFDLKPDFPYGSPPQGNISPGSDGPYQSRGASGQGLHQLKPHPGPAVAGQVNYNMIHHPITPPISATDDESKTDSPVVQSMAMMANQRPPPAQQTSVPSQETFQGQWNPTRIFDQWHAAFGTPPSSSTSQSSPPLRAPSSGTYEARSSQEAAAVAGAPQGYSAVAGAAAVAAQSAYSPQSGSIQSQLQALPPPTSSYAAPSPVYVTPTMWQDVVASSFSDGLKRRWDYEGQAAMAQQMAKRQR